MTSVLLTLITLGATNTPYPKGFTLIPQARVEHSFSLGAFGAFESSARCLPKNPIRWNPLTAKWTVEAGFRKWGFEVAAGHTSEHGIDKVQLATESSDYIRLVYKKDFP